MTTMSGGVDENGRFFFTEEFSTKSALDMERLRDEFRNPEIHCEVESYDDERVVLKVWPSWGACGYSY